MSSMLDVATRDRTTGLKARTRWGSKAPIGARENPPGPHRALRPVFGGITRRGGAKARGGALAVLLAFFTFASPALAREVRIVAFGDSLTAGHGIAKKDAFPAKLEVALRAKGYDVAVVNAGVSGETAPQGLARLDWSVPDGTDAVIVELGANDMLRGQSPEIARNALTEIVQRLKARGIRVLLAGMRAAPNLGPDYRARFDPIYPDIAKAEGVLLYPFFLEGVTGDPALNLPDGLHPNPRGVDRIVAGILPKAEELVGEVDAKGSAPAQAAR